LVACQVESGAANFHAEERIYAIEVTTWLRPATWFAASIWFVTSID
jgi:hypothetical protein